MTSPTNQDVQRLAAFLRREFPNAVSHAQAGEVVVNTAMTIMLDMKTALEARDGTDLDEAKEE